MFEREEKGLIFSTWEIEISLFFFSRFCNKKWKIIKMGSDICMACEDISLPIFLEVGLEFLITIFSFIFIESWIIEKSEIIRWEEWSNELSMFFYKISPFFSIEIVCGRYFSKSIIPKIKITSSSFSFTNFLEKSISLSHDELIFSPNLSELTKCSS